MTTESLEDLRNRLLRHESVQRMIQMRAYEIYQMRGGQPGGEAQDWFHAEGEVLAYLIAGEGAREDAQAEDELAPAAETPAQPEQKPVSVGKPRKRRTLTKANATEAKAQAPKKSAPKRSAARKSTPSKSKTKPTSNQAKTDESGR